VSYEFTYTNSCGECLEAFARPYVIRVEAGEVVEVRDAQTAADPPSGFDAPTIVDLFDTVESMLDGEAYRLGVTYDPVMGYPTEISVDLDRLSVDDEFVLSVRDLAASS
jgi:hypothetical protein